MSELSAKQSVLCSVLSNIGGDGDCAGINRLSVDELKKEIMTQVKWLEERAYVRGKGKNVK
jgi:hypothetical protein